MGERADGVKGDHGGSGALEREISGIRDELGALVGELDRRRRELFDVRGHVRRHPLTASLAGLAVLAVLGGSVAVLVYDTRRKQRASYRAKQLRIAVGRMIEHPERVARGGEAPPGEKILAAVGTAIATLLVKQALARAVPAPRVAAHEAQARAENGRPRARA
jgi:hypothetical protein